MPFHLCRTPMGLGLGQLDLLTPWSEGPDRAPYLDQISQALPGGLSRHGQFYLYPMASWPEPKDVGMELLFEQVRQQFYPHRPSRLQSFFATSSHESAKALPLSSPSPVTYIYEVDEIDAGSSFVANMALLNTVGHGGLMLSRAHNYWSGLEGDIPPTWEILIPRRVNVVRQVEQIISLPPNLIIPESSSALETQ